MHKKYQKRPIIFDIFYNYCDNRMEDTKHPNQDIQHNNNQRNNIPPESPTTKIIFPLMYTYGTYLPHGNNDGYAPPGTPKAKHTGNWYPNMNILEVHSPIGINESYSSGFNTATQNYKANMNHPQQQHPINTRLLTNQDFILSSKQYCVNTNTFYKMKWSCKCQNKVDILLFYKTLQHIASTCEIPLKCRMTYQKNQTC